MNVKLRTFKLKGQFSTHGEKNTKLKATITLLLQIPNHIIVGYNWSYP